LNTKDLLSFRAYSAKDHDACLAVFDANCPEYFAPNEREDYVQFLTTNPAGYVVCVLESMIIGSYGTWVEADGRRGHISWIMIDPAGQGRSVGSNMMKQAYAAFKSAGVYEVEIAASQKSAPFFARFGAVENKRITEGWGPGLDRVNMVWTL
jgi:ribosomal protein S18 acetylase RimI-like enzyme